MATFAGPGALHDRLMLCFDVANAKANTNRVLTNLGYASVPTLDLSRYTQTGLSVKMPEYASVLLPFYTDPLQYAQGTLELQFSTSLPVNTIRTYDAGTEVAVGLCTQCSDITVAICWSLTTKAVVNIYVNGSLINNIELPLLNIAPRPIHLASLVPTGAMYLTMFRYYDTQLTADQIFVNYHSTNTRRLK